MIKRFLHSEIFRYLFIGGCTTVLNTGLFLGLCSFTPLGDTEEGITIYNAISIIITVITAYVLNKFIVFRSEAKTGVLAEMIKFFSLRAVTMLVELGGVYFAINILDWSKFVSKISVQIIVVILNYIFSKLIIFSKNDD